MTTYNIKAELIYIDPDDGVDVEISITINKSLAPSTAKNVLKALYPNCVSVEQLKVVCYEDSTRTLA